MVRLLLAVVVCAVVPRPASAFQPTGARTGPTSRLPLLRNARTDEAGDGSGGGGSTTGSTSAAASPSIDRRSALQLGGSGASASAAAIAAAAAASTLLTFGTALTPPPPAFAAQSGGAYAASKDGDQTDYIQKYDDFTLTDEGWSYKDVKPGSGDVAIADGDRVVFDWSGYTIGYFGRPFEAKGGPQGGAFDKDLDYQRTVVGSHTVVGGLECALRSMKPGGIRQVVVPYGPLSYPPADLDHAKVGPRPSTFSGQRALNFVLENPRVDRTLLFNVKVIRVDKKDPKTGGFTRG